MQIALRVTAASPALLGLLVASPSLAQTLTLGGECPGPVTFRIDGATPGGKIALLSADGPGAEAVPGGPCAGTPLGLAGDVTVRKMLTADGAGSASAAPTLPDGVCTSWVQGLDLATCAPTAALALPQPGGGPTAIDISCIPVQNPLRAGCTVTVDPPQPVQVRYARTDGLGIERSRTSDLVAAEHPIGVVYMAPGEEYEIVATAVDWPQGLSATTTFVTGAPPQKWASRIRTDAGASTIGLIGSETPCAADALAVIYDTYTGDLVWYEDLDETGKLGMLDMVRFIDDGQTILGETDGRIVEVDLLGNTIADFPVNYPGCCGLHHDVNKHGGLYYAMYQDTRQGLTVDEIVMLDAQGDQVGTWNPRDHLPIPDDASGDWLHTNTLFVLENGDLLTSYFQRDSLARIDGDPSSPTFGDVKWIMGGNPPDPLPSDITVDWSRVPGANFFGGQHDFSLRHDGRYMVLDSENGRAVVFSIDEGAGTATADAVYETVENSCGAQGTASDTRSGNVLVACFTPQLREYDGASGALSWQATIECVEGDGGFFDSSSARWYTLDGW